MRWALVPGVAAGLGLLAVPAAAGSSGSQSACLSGRQASVLAVYTLAGGLTLESTTLVVRRNGRVTLNLGDDFGARVFRIGCARLRALHRALELARFSTLSGAYGHDYPSRDSPTESVTYRGRTVDVLPLGSRPARLVRVLRLLRALAVI